MAMNSPDKVFDDMLLSLNRLETHMQKTAELTAASFEESFKDISASCAASFAAMADAADSFRGKTDWTDTLARAAAVLPEVSTKAGATGVAFAALAFSISLVVKALRAAKQVEFGLALGAVTQGLERKTAGNDAFWAALNSGASEFEAEKARKVTEAQYSFEERKTQSRNLQSQMHGDLARLWIERQDLLKRGEDLATVVANDEKFAARNPGAENVMFADVRREHLDKIYADLQKNAAEYNKIFWAIEGEEKSSLMGPSLEVRRARALEDHVPGEPLELGDPLDWSRLKEYKQWIDSVVSPPGDSAAAQREQQLQSTLNETASEHRQTPEWVDRSPVAYASVFGISDIPILNDRKFSGAKEVIDGAEFAGAEALASGASVAATAADSAKRTFHDLSAALDENAKKATEATESISNVGDAFLKSLPKHLQGAAGTLIGGIGGVAGKITQAVSTSKTFTPHEIAANVGAALLTSTKQFQRILDAVNPQLEALVDVLGTGLEPVLRILEPLTGVFTRMVRAIEPLLSLYNDLNAPLMAAAFAVRTLADAVDAVSDSILTAMIGVLKAIKKALKKMHISWKGLDRAIDSLRDLRDAGDEAAEALGAIAGVNIPPGYNLALRRWGTDEANGPSSDSPGAPNAELVAELMNLYRRLTEAMADGNSSLINYLLRKIEEVKAQMEDEGGGSSGTGTNASGMTAAESQPESGARTIIVEHIDIHGVQDADSLWRELERVGQRRGVVRHSSPLRASMGRG